MCICAWERLVKWQWKRAKVCVWERERPLHLGIFHFLSWHFPAWLIWTLYSAFALPYISVSWSNHGLEKWKEKGKRNVVALHKFNKSYICLYFYSNPNTATLPVGLRDTFVNVIYISLTLGLWNKCSTMGILSSVKNIFPRLHHCQHTKCVCLVQ